MVRDFAYGPFREPWNQHHTLLVSQFLCCSSLVPFPALPLPSQQLEILRALSWALLSLLLYPLSPGTMIHSQGLKKKKESVFRTHLTSHLHTYIHSHNCLPMVRLLQLNISKVKPLDLPYLILPSLFSHQVLMASECLHPFTCFGQKPGSFSHLHLPDPSSSQELLLQLLVVSWVSSLSASPLPPPSPSSHYLCSGEWAPLCCFSILRYFSLFIHRKPTSYPFHFL